jgi:NAD(P)-dependent dehydrogenase (short-subunit alcohol dehydrogenase family)
MSSPAKDVVAVVTGANRGLGLEITRQLARRGAQVWLTARRSDAGEAAVAQLAAEGLAARFHQLDVTDALSCTALADSLSTAPGRVDVLVNNAGIMRKADGQASEAEPATMLEIFQTNTLGALRITQALLPLLRASAGARIVNMSSGMGALSDMQGGWAGYRTSKAALNALTAMLADELAPHIVVNAMCPGWVKTDMGGDKAPRSVAQGADTAVWLALDAPRRTSGKFLRDRKIIPW